MPCFKGTRIYPTIYETAKVMNTTDTNSETPNRTNEAVIFLKNAYVKYQHTEILSNFNLKIANGEFVYLVGKTGSGKSSLMKVLYGAMPFHGEIGLVASKNLQEMTPSTIHRLRKNLGIIFQDINLFEEMSVLENLRFALKANGKYSRRTFKRSIEKALSIVQLEQIEKKQVHFLSGGERQRVAIARALLNEPKLILADEPTGNLDPDTSDEIIELIRNIALRKNVAVVLATHDYRIINNYPARVIRINNRRVVDQYDSYL